MTLTANYGTQVVTLGDTINLNAATNWSDVVAASFDAINLPSGLSISNVGVITGDLAVAGVVDCTVTVDGTNGSKQSGGINWNISPA